MILKDDLIKIIKKETATTIKAMSAFPAGKLSFVPHERSRNAGQLMATFLFEMYLIESYAFGEKIDRSIFQTYAPADIQTLVSDFEKESSRVVSMLEKMPESEMSKSVEFAKKKGTAGDFIFMMISDQIHHRGQLTIYIRLAGGKVPSVYGPSADDPSTNL
jgi:hypothetical protein